MAKEITAELTDEQFEKYQIMKEYNLEIGDAIELIFNLHDQLGLRNEELIEERIEELLAKKESLEEEIREVEGSNDKKESLNDEVIKIDQELGVIEKLRDNRLDYDAKAEVLEKEYATIETNNELKVLKQRRGLKWADFFYKTF